VESGSWWLGGGEGGFLQCPEAVCEPPIHATVFLSCYKARTNLRTNCYLLVARKCISFLSAAAVFFQVRKSTKIWRENPPKESANPSSETSENPPKSGEKIRQRNPPIPLLKLQPAGGCFSVSIIWKQNVYNFEQLYSK
jgi:hypothetical protein